MKDMEPHRKSIYFSIRNSAKLMPLTFLGLFILSCEDPMILMNDSEKGLWRYQTGIPDKEANLLQVKNLSRDLEICINRRKYPPLSEQQIKQLAIQNNHEIYDELIKTLPLCKGVVDYLFKKIDQAYDTGNQLNQLNQAIVDGKAESLLQLEKNK
ncbi:hypothetical protein QGP82_14070 [Leptothoe sp. LEGE 181152]|nr:hypothetical protein [Leptothoe sp. LEGE 181152]